MTASVRSEPVRMIVVDNNILILSTNGVLSQSRVRALVDEMEVAEHMIIANKEAIFDR